MCQVLTTELSSLRLQLGPLLDQILQVDRILDQLGLTDILLDPELTLQLPELQQFVVVLLVLSLLYR